MKFSAGQFPFIEARCRVVAFSFFVPRFRNAPGKFQRHRGSFPKGRRKNTAGEGKNQKAQEILPISVYYLARLSGKDARRAVYPFTTRTAPSNSLYPRRGRGGVDALPRAGALERQGRAKGALLPEHASRPRSGHQSGLDGRSPVSPAPARLSDAGGMNV